MKDLIISWNEDKGFYCEEFSSNLFINVITNIIEKYNLEFDPSKAFSEFEIFMSARELNSHKYNLELLQEDGSQWIFG